MNTLSKAYEVGTTFSHNIIPLDFESIDGVPESHLWSQSDESHQKIQTNNPRDSLIPVIDLSDPCAIDLIGQACKTWGMFQVINHGVPLELVKKVEFEARRLFSLTTHEKRKVLRSPTGATGYGLPRISPFFAKCMWHEGFTIMGSCVDDAKVLWPHDYQRFCDTMDDYQNQMKLLAHKLLLLSLQTLDVTQEEINWATSTHGSNGALQLNSYPSCPNPSRTLGLAPHTDSLLLTILNQYGITGLEIFVEGLGWSPVCPIEGAFVVNVGDLLHIFSNAKFPVVYHRAVVNQSKHRISVAYFYGPPIESTLAPLSNYQDPCFRSLLVKEYIRLKATHNDKALSLIRI
ncbi:gibberellin 3-beta-dioxygenase 1 [Lactuca sativa]|uniref:gibberellin 3beta-dioxygenase n=1 Tax=Lactuca sativa TaxID=4236 RepID=A0A9R1XTX4_LACSA|nr:gibberellin 3-beta-dioxygenase 1 [Lactuca sativa]KAJ0225444.1 hypothetical protein LSAT_V11C100018910 [Lactuca sativa]